jgi:DNA-binding NarL/FixJ family response regulator
MPRLIIVDDHPLFRVGLGYALRSLGFDIIAEAGDGVEGVRRVTELKPDAVLLDAKMPRMDGLEACRQMVAALPGLRVVLLTTFSEPALVHAARDAGASGFVSKETEAERLGQIVTKMLEDATYTLFPTVDLPKLSPRELEVLRLMATGQSNKEIAKVLGLSPDTVKDHLENLYRKLEASDRVTAAKRAQQLGLV